MCETMFRDCCVVCTLPLEFPQKQGEAFGAQGYAPRPPPCGGKGRMKKRSRPPMLRWHWLAWKRDRNHARLPAWEAAAAVRSAPVPPKTALVTVDAEEAAAAHNLAKEPPEDTPKSIMYTHTQKLCRHTPTNESQAVLHPDRQPTMQPKL